MSGQDDDTDKSFEPTPRKLEEARKKGEIAKSTDLFVAAAYAGLILAALGVGSHAFSSLGNAFVAIIDRADVLASLMFEGGPSAPTGTIIAAIAPHLAAWFAVPAIAVILMIIAQKAFIVTPSKLVMKVSRISPISNAKNKYGRAGLFEFGKSFVKLTVYSIALGVFLTARLPEILGAAQLSPGMAIAKMLSMTVAFLFVVLGIAIAIGTVDYIFQHAEHLRKNRMSFKEMQDESKEVEGDPYLKQERRQRAQKIANNQMLSDVPQADVVIVNPTHFAVALKWSKLPGEAPECVAKGQDEIALRIREIATEANVPIHSDPPTARALFATVEIGQQIQSEHYRAVAAAIRFAEAIRMKARGGFS